MRIDLVKEFLFQKFQIGVSLSDKLLFGSDFPVTTPKYAIERLRAVNDILEGTKLPRISMEHIEGIILADASTALNLKDPRKK
jgi:predicted TIM-barrel fold metal-dependent hydrolase